MFCVVCISANGCVTRTYHSDIETARDRLEFAEETARYVSGSIYGPDDTELDGFARD